MRSFSLLLSRIVAIIIFLFFTVNIAFADDCQDNPDRKVFVVFDTETTGFYPEINKLTEIGAVKFCFNDDFSPSVITTFSQFIDPEVPIPLHITEFTGISDEMVKGMPKTGEAVEMFQEFIVGVDTLIGQNVPFDMYFLGKAIKDNNLLPFAQLFFDTKRFTRALFPEFGYNGYRTKSLAERWGIPLGARHRALDDAKITMRVTANALRIGMKKFGIHQFSSIPLNPKTTFFMSAEYERAFPKEERDPHCSNLPQEDSESLEKFWQSTRAVGKQQYKAVRPSALADVAEEMGVCYFMLRDALTAIEQKRIEKARAILE